MAMSNAERQRRYRERAYRDPDGHLLTRVTLSLGVSPAAALKRLASGYAITQRELIERLLIEADRAALDRLDPSQYGAYLDGHLPAGALQDNDQAKEALPCNEANPEPLRHNAEPATETEPSKPPLDLEPTTPAQADREARVLELHQGGMAKRAIARELGLSESGVRGILKRLAPATSASPTRHP